jgi:PhoH-like ATPase
MNPDVDFGRYLLVPHGQDVATLAAGLMLTLEFKVYSEITATRVTAPLGEDIGFPAGNRGGEDESVDGRARGQSRCAQQDGRRRREWGRATRDLIRSRIKVMV